MGAEEKMTFLEHFGILRKSLIKIVLLMIILFVPAFYYRELIMELALVPISSSLPSDSKIIFTTLYARRGMTYPDQLIYGEETFDDSYVVFPWDKLEFKKSLK